MFVWTASNIIIIIKQDDTIDHYAPQSPLRNASGQHPRPVVAPQQSFFDRLGPTCRLRSSPKRNSFAALSDIAPPIIHTLTENTSTKHISRRTVQPGRTCSLVFGDGWLPFCRRSGRLSLGTRSCAPGLCSREAQCGRGQYMDRGLWVDRADVRYKQHEEEWKIAVRPDVVAPQGSIARPEDASEAFWNHVKAAR